MFFLLTALAFGAPLTLADVQESIDTRLPPLSIAVASQAEAEAALLKARAAFDPTLVGDALRVEGAYPTTRVSAKMKVETSLGPVVWGKYRYGSGDFAVYDGKPETLSGGEVGVGVSVPLLRDLGLSSARATVMQAADRAAAATLEVDDTRRLVTRDATIAYWRWVAAGRKLALTEDLLRRAQARGEGLQREVTEGSRAAIDLLDNEATIAKREAQLAGAEAKLAGAAQSLGLYVRDAAGAPLVPSVDRLPDEVLIPYAPSDLAEGLDHAVRERPDLEAIALMLSAAETGARRGRRSILPSLHVVGGVQQDLGTGPSYLEPLEVQAGVVLKTTMMQRSGRAQFDLATAKAHQVSEKLRWAQDKVEAEVRARHASLEAAHAKWIAAERAASLAEELLVMERRRVELGNSDIFRLVLREEKLLEAASTAVDAEAALGTALARWSASIAVDVRGGSVE